MLPASGAVPVVIKSLIFPTTAAIGKEWQAARIGEPAPYHEPKEQHDETLRTRSLLLFAHLHHRVGPTAHQGPRRL